MLVEDDNNLREIYEARLLAEGYQIVSARDGEEALALAVKEKPDLIISDVMMPKISGFDMLDILRSTPETKNTKVVMMTALSQAEDKNRAGKLGADRYLVKSQVTLEDVAKVAREVLKGEDEMPPLDPASTAPEPDKSTTNNSAEPIEVASPPPTADPSTPPATSQDPATPADPVADDSSAQEPSTTSPTPPTPTSVDPSLSESTKTEETEVDSQINDFLAQAVEPTTPSEPTTTTPPSTPQATTPVASLDVTDAPNDELTDKTSDAAENAAKVAEAVNDLLEKDDAATDVKPAEPSAPAPGVLSPNDPPAGTSNVTVAGKKVIQPLNPITQTEPEDLVKQAQEEEEDHPSASPLPPSTVIDSDGKAVTPTQPAAEGDAPNEHAPGNVIQPGSDPNNIAL